MSVTAFSNEAWLFQSIVHSDNGEGATLAAIIATGDYINHSIFTLAEINSGLINLSVLKLIRFENEKAFVTESGRSFFEQLKPESRSMQKEMQLIATKFMLMIPESDLIPTDPVSKKAYDKACEEYLR